MLGEFKEFINRGNVVDMAVGVVVGAAFGKIVASFTDDLLMPPLGLVLGKVDFTNLFIALNGQVYETLDAAKKAGAPTLNYGLFVNNIVNFLIIAFAVFLFVKAVNRMKRAEAPAPPPAPTTRDCPFCLSAIPLKATKCGHCTSEVTPAT